MSPTAPHKAQKRHAIGYPAFACDAIHIDEAPKSNKVTEKRLPSLSCIKAKHGLKCFHSSVVTYNLLPLSLSICRTATSAQHLPPIPRWQVGNAAKIALPMSCKADTLAHTLQSRQWQSPPASAVKPRRSSYMTLAKDTQSETAQQRPSMVSFLMRRSRAGAQAASQSLRTAVAAAVKKPGQASGSGRKADALGARRGVKDGVVGAHKHVAQDPERAGRRRQVEAHEARDALLLAARAHLPTIITHVRLVTQIAIKSNRESSRSRPIKPTLGCY